MRPGRSSAIEADPPSELFHQPAMSQDFDRIRWFMLSDEALAELRGAEPSPAATR
jgi:hypothetical protein